jgi:hypothetical protein
MGCKRWHIRANPSHPIIPDEIPSQIDRPAHSFRPEWALPSHLCRENRAGPCKIRHAIGCRSLPRTVHIGKEAFPHLTLYGRMPLTVLRHQYSSLVRSVDEISCPALFGRANPVSSSHRFVGDSPLQRRNRKLSTACCSQCCTPTGNAFGLYHAICLLIALR